MPAFRRSYTLYKRGKVYYYMTRTPAGDRTCGHSTGCVSKSAARAYCDSLLKAGTLYQGAAARFRDYAAGFFDEGSPWIEDRMSTGTPDNPALSRSTLHKYRTDLRMHIMEFFGARKLQDIRPSDTKLFRKWLAETQRLSPKTINNTLGTFRVICDAALADGAMVYDPLRGIKPLKGKLERKDAFTLEEVQELVKTADPRIRSAVAIAASTGMRLSEILAIRPETIGKGFIDVRDQLLQGELCAPKTKVARKVPFPVPYRSVLDGAVLHLSASIIGKYMARAIVGMENAKERKLSFHSLRHFFNTYLLSENVAPHKVAAVLGHSTGATSVQAQYTNWRPEHFPEVYAAQGKLLALLGPDLPSTVSARQPFP
jgi:integrase